MNQVTATPNRSVVRRGSVGSGRVLMWPGGSIWVSRGAGMVPPHAHHVMQVTLAPMRPIRLRGASSTEWFEANACIVMPDRRHAFDGCGQDVVMLFVEPESREGRQLRRLYGRADLMRINDPTALVMARKLLAALDDPVNDDAGLIYGARRIVERLAGEETGADIVDSRVLRVIDWMRDRLDMPMTLAQAATVAHLSPGRFRHLFVAQTGISFRAYLLWARVSRAIVRGMAGASWTSAAQQSGFADSAHLTRTCRRMFGIAPTMLGRDEQK